VKKDDITDVAWIEAAAVHLGLSFTPRARPPSQTDRKSVMSPLFLALSSRVARFSGEP
jgi:hypothetical protein